jgi:hypothetical protein
MTRQARRVAVVVVFVVLLGLTGGYLAMARASQQRQQRVTTPQTTMAAAEVLAGPHIAFLDTAAGPLEAQAALVPLDAPGGPRAVTDLVCERLYAAAARTVCLGSTFGLTPVYRAKVLSPGSPTIEVPLGGTPSRARLSADAKLAATTVFVSGDSYDVAGFSTRTVINRLGTGENLDLEDFRLVHRGKVIRPVDRNYWGVTFSADGDGFFVTVAFGEQTWLARGSLRSKTVRTIRSDAECPSLSPDGQRVAYKKLSGRAPGDWRIAVLDLASGKETVLAEDRSVDDQVEWLDDTRLLYAVPRDTGGQLASDVWVLPADGMGAASVFIRDAASPAVVR